MKKGLLTALMLTLFAEPAFADNQYIYCITTRLDGTEKNHIRWAKGKDLTFNRAENRWERNSELSLERFYENGRYEQVALVPYFDNRVGRCGAAAEAKYKKIMEELRKKYP